MLDFFGESASTYLFLSQMFFKELNEETVRELAATEFPANTGNELLDEGYRLVKRYFTFSSSDRRTQLACEYARVFLAAGVYSKGASTAVPYESVFTSEEHIMMQDSRDDVLARYRADGFEVNPDLHEPEDHVAFEFEYLSEMSARAQQLAEAGDTKALIANIKRQISFIDDHLLNWLPSLEAAVREYAKLTFYIGMLKVARGTLEVNRDKLHELAKDAARA